MLAQELDSNGRLSLQMPSKSGVKQSLLGRAPGILCQGLPTYILNPPVEAVVFAWGVSEDMQLGLDTTDNVATPKVVESLLGTRFRGREFNRLPLVAGSRNTLAIDADGNVWSWGWNDRGTLGHGHRGKESQPKRIQALRGAKIAQVALGGWHCLAVTQDGEVFSWGGNEYQQCGVDPDKRDIVVPTRCLSQLKVLQVACGGMHSLALTELGEVACGSMHSLALTELMEVWMWGEPWGDFALNVQRSPRRVEGATNVVSISCGAFHNMVLTAEGEVFTWGTNDHGQLGTGSTTYNTKPCRVVGLEDTPVADISAGGWHSVVISSAGEVWVWGRGEYGRLGIGDRSGSSKLRPHKVRGLEGHCIVQVSAGGTHTTALSKSGRMFIWGRGSFGRLGLGIEKDHYSPVELQLPGGHYRWKVIAVSAGGRHNVCLALPQRDASGDGEAFEDEEDEMSGVNGGSERSLHGASEDGEADLLAESSGSPLADALLGEYQGEDAEADAEEDDEENQGTLAEERNLSSSPMPFDGARSLRNA